jgi:putative hemolysin
MSLLAVFGMALLALVLILVTLIQTLYLESMRLRSRDMPALQFFKQVLDGRLGLKTEAGALTFTLIKHTLLLLMAAWFVAFTSQGTGYVTPRSFGEAFGLSWLVMLGVAYVVPQVLYRRTSGHWLVPFVPVLRLAAAVFRPLTALLAFLQSLVELAEPEVADASPATSEDHIEALITAGTEEGIIEEDDRKLIQSAAAFGSKTVREVMTSRPNIVAISASKTLNDLRQLVINEQYSRVPVYEGDIDHVTGFVHVRDMFELDEAERGQRKVKELVREISFVPETKPVDTLLREMQQEGNHIAVVVDEYGNTAGLVTMEDMVEELVGEIRDEHEPAMDVQPDGDGYIVSGSFDVDRLEDLLHYKPEEDTESTTVAGLVTEWAGRVPRVGDTVNHDGIRVDILAGNELRVDQLRISRVETNTNGS